MLNFIVENAIQKNSNRFYAFHFVLFSRKKNEAKKKAQ